MIKAVGDKIVVEELKRTKTEGGIILPDSSSDPQGYGKVLSFGEDVENLNVGDVIVFHNRGGQASLGQFRMGYHSYLNTRQFHGNVCATDRLSIQAGLGYGAKVRAPVQ